MGTFLMQTIQADYLSKRSACFYVTEAPPYGNAYSDKIRATSRYHLLYKRYPTLSSTFDHRYSDGCTSTALQQYLVNGRQNYHIIDHRLQKIKAECFIKILRIKVF